MDKLCDITIDGQNYALNVARYDNGRVAIVIDEGRYAKLTVNVHDQPLAAGHVHIKTWGENERLREPALATGMFEDTGERVPCGWVEAEVWKFVGGTK